MAKDAILQQFPEGSDLDLEAVLSFAARLFMQDSSPEEIEAEI